MSGINIERPVDYSKIFNYINRGQEIPPELSARMQHEYKISIARGERSVLEIDPSQEPISLEANELGYRPERPRGFK